MSHQKRHLDRVYQVIDEPGSGSIAVGYVRSSSVLHDSMSITTQKQRITELATGKRWEIVRWYEESEQSAGYEDVERRPVFAQLLSDAGAEFQIVLCARSRLWSHDVALAYRSLDHLRRLQVWWATADGLWDTNKVELDGIQVICHIEAHQPTRRVARKEVR
jgi:DNA invertase Pin-like site-specific DNA recombinase